MLFLEAAAHAGMRVAAATAGEGGEQAAEQAPAFETGSILHPLYANHLLNDKILPEEVLISLVMTLLIGLIIFALTRRLDVRRPSKTQAALELIVSSLQNMVTGLIGPDGPRYLPVVGTLFIYILILNLAGIIPLWKSPTANLNVTVALALSTIVYVHYHAIRANGLVGYLRHYVGEPWQMFLLNIPLHIIGELARPISLRPCSITAPISTREIIQDGPRGHMPRSSATRTSPTCSARRESRNDSLAGGRRGKNQTVLVSNVRVRSTRSSSQSGLKRRRAPSSRSSVATESSTA